MHIRTSRSKRNGKVYEYPQLVESYRRESDGMPMKRVVGNLSGLSATELENLRVALDAARRGKRVVAARSRSEAAVLPIMANLRYLDVAVLIELWREWGLDELLAEALPQGEAAVPPADVVAALTIQRCVEPGSKLYATEWFPRTALPELLNLAPAQFNNTRLHRVLDDLDAANPVLMAKLARCYQDREGAFAALFLDGTDTWFVGQGPTFAERAKTKEGLVERKIGIVLLCNQQGYPLRWEVIGGRESEVVAMSRMLGLVAELPWTKQVPLVSDRAMGRSAQIGEMLAAKLFFVTALTKTEYDAYTDRIPHQMLAGFEPRDDTLREEDIAEAARLIEKAGLQRVEDHLFVQDLGIVERVAEDAVEQPASAHEDEALAKIMQMVRSAAEAIAAGRYASQASAGRALGISKALMSRYCILLRLPETVQQQILEGKAHGRSLENLIRIARLDDAQKQVEAFAALMASPRSRRASAKPLGIVHEQATMQPETAPKSIRVRAVLYFNPQLFVDQRRRAREELAAIQSFVDELNTRLASPRSRMKRDQIAAAIDRRLRKDDLLEAFTPIITEQQIAGNTRYQVELPVDQAQWSLRRRYDGFNVIVANPDLDRSATDLCRLYRAKDVVEKDFQTIKSLVELRPIRHHVDGKVRAHVTLCMLSLLLERILQHRLAGMCTADRALALLESCHLNRLRSKESIYTVTETEREQKAILRRLRLTHLVDDDAVGALITPRDQHQS
ncbi:MAG: hypothetical protein V2A73_10565 [Pseudomonadota bacterium]